MVIIAYSMVFMHSSKSSWNNSDYQFLFLAGMHRPDITKEHCEVSYTLPGSSTGLEVRGFKVQKSTPERWVKYEIHYRYRVQMFPDLSID